MYSVELPHLNLPCGNKSDGSFSLVVGIIVVRINFNFEDFIDVQMLVNDLQTVSASPFYLHVHTGESLTNCEWFTLLSMCIHW